MSGPRPLHLSRRGPVYVIRLTLPKDLRDATGVIDIRRSLKTKTIDVARRRCLDAERWFSDLVRQLRAMSNPTRDDIERAAARYFVVLRDQVDQPRQWAADNYDHELAFNIEATRRRIDELEDQLRTNDFGGGVNANADEMLAPLSVSLDALGSQLAMFAKQLAAKAERQQMLYFEHVLQSPAIPFVADDRLFDGNTSANASPPTLQGRGMVSLPTLLEPTATAGMCLSSLIDDHKASMIDRGVQESRIIDFERVARWALTEFGADTPIGNLTTDALRGFRDKLRKLDKTVRQSGKDTLKSLDASLTDERAKQIKSETARRYWAYVRAMLSRAVSEGFLDRDPAGSLEIQLRKDEKRQSPVPYDAEELRRFFAMPVFTGRRSKARQKEPGNYQARDGYFWSGLLQAYTGMRGCEVTPLLPEDFVFDAEMPHILVRMENEAGEKVKSTKTAASARAIPIADDLLSLGLRQFISARSKRAPGQRVFSEFPIGTRGKKSDGLSKFWRRYISEFGLHKPGRAIHVWRHTVVYHLRRRGVSYEDVGYLIGHKVNSPTAFYGDGELLERVRTHSLERLDYGFSVVDAVGGKYDPKIHAE